MRQDILDMVARRTESRMVEERGYVDDNPMYEDPRDVIGMYLLIQVHQYNALQITYIYFGIVHITMIQ